MRVARRNYLFTVVVLTIVAVACRTGVVPEVTKAQYDAAFDRFRGCVHQGGGEISAVSVNPEFGTYQYGYSDDDSVLVDNCYVDHFLDAQVGFESNHEAMLAADAEENRREWEEEVLPCLRANDFDDVPADFDAVMERAESMELYRAYSELMMRGLCDASIVEE